MLTVSVSLLRIAVVNYYISMLLLKQGHKHYDLSIIFVVAMQPLSFVNNVMHCRIAGKFGMVKFW